jgi:single-stranded-DNA-specific exonuclease
LAVVGFDMIKHYESLVSGKPFSMAFTVEENVFNGNTSIQLKIKDLLVND